ncbi:hypothetical protein ACHAW6_007678 [Cyclotella cf. meneghiniana]
MHLKAFKTELDHLVDLGVLAPTTESEWASPSFIVPKKDGRVHWISNLCQLNKVIRRKQYPLPIIMDILWKRSGSLYYNHSFRKIKYLRLPMGLKCSPDIVWSIMESVLAGIDDADIYIDDFGAFSQTWEYHIKLLGNILRCFHEMASLLTH